MKKILLLLSFMPVALFAQNSKPHPYHGALVKYQPMPKEGQISPVQNHLAPKATAPVARHDNKPAPQSTHFYVPAVSDTIGTTVYDLQTNGALAKRLQLYPNGKASYVWIKSDDIRDGDFTTRYSGYNSYDGANWISPYGNSTEYEYDRSGWPSIGSVTANGSTYEMLTSHYAQAASTSYAGGIFWYKNSGIGKTDFTQTIDLSSNRGLTSGLLWPRMATSGDKIYMIGTYEDDRIISGVINPVVYFRYNISTGKFDAKGITLPGYDATRYGSNGADQYSIDARGAYVAILIGGDLHSPNDLALWKSSDSGVTFTKTIIDSFAAAPWNYRRDSTFNDTLLIDDGTGSVTLDNKGVAHVCYSPMLVTNPNPYGLDSGLNGYIPDNSGIIYWNDEDQKKIRVGGVIDYEHTGDTLLIQTLFSENTDQNTAGYGHQLACYSNISVDDQGHVFVVFSAPDVDDEYYGNWGASAFRHVYCSVFDGQKWLPQQDIVQTWQEENVFATVAPIADSKLHLVFMQDDAAGILIPGSTTTQQDETTDTMIYQEISTADLLSGAVGLDNGPLGINQNTANNIFSTGSVFPNPANDRINLSLNLTRPATVTVKLYNMLGEEMQAQNFEKLPTGNNNLQLGLNNLQPGVYLCNISADGFTTTKRVVVEK